MKKEHKKIEEFLRTWFRLFGFNYQQLLGEFDDENNCFLDPVIAQDDTLCMETIERAAEMLGVPTEAILSANDSSVRKWLQKYKFFELVEDLNFAQRASFFAEGYTTFRLMEAIWSENPEKTIDQYPSRYNKKEVFARLQDTLKEIDKVYPGTFHSGATIKTLSFSTTNFYHFDKINELCQCFLDMVERAKTLFFRALDADLSPKEIYEYNFLVTVTGMQDAVAPSKEMYYSRVQRLRRVYKQENLENFHDYVCLSQCRSFCPFQCAEFLNDKEMVQKFANLYPQMKNEMRQFGLAVSKFTCCYTWSDEECEEPNVVYVAKTEEEMRGDGKYAETIRVLSGPETLGGIRQIPRRLDIERVIARASIGGGANV